MALRGISMILVLYGAPLFLLGAVLYRLNADFRAFVDRVRPYYQLASAVVMLLVGVVGGAVLVFVGEEFVRSHLAARAADPDLLVIGLFGGLGFLIGVIGYVLLQSARRRIRALASPSR